jgi:hypothetical protein
MDEKPIDHPPTPTESSGEPTNGSSPHRVHSIGTRIAIAVTIGVIAGFVCLSPYVYRLGGDFALWPVRAARDILTGMDPYSYQIEDWEVSYPLTAALIAIPFAPFRDDIAGALFISLSSTLMALALTKDGQYWRLMAFLSVPYISSVMTVQWGPLMVAAAVYPHLLPFSLAKPQIGLAIVGYKKPSLLGIALSIALVGLTIVIQPDWPIKWLASVNEYRGFIPLMQPFGFVLLLALFRWRDPSARLLLLMAILPKRAEYDMLPLWLIPNSRRAMLVYTLLTSTTALIGIYFAPMMALAAIYFPLLIIILSPLYRTNIKTIIRQARTDVQPEATSQQAETQPSDRQSPLE